MFGKDCLVSGDYQAEPWNLAYQSVERLFSMNRFVAACLHAYSFSARIFGRRCPYCAVPGDGSLVSRGAIPGTTHPSPPTFRRQS